MMYTPEEIYNLILKNKRYYKLTEDDIQEIFILIWNKIDTFDPSISLIQTFVAASSRYYKVTQYRKANSNKEVTFNTLEGGGNFTLEFPSDELNYLDETILQEKEESALEGLKLLNDIEKKVMMLWANQYSYEDIQEELELNRDNIAAIIFRSKKILRGEKESTKEFKYELLNNYTNEIKVFRTQLKVAEFLQCTPANIYEALRKNGRLRLGMYKITKINK